MTTNLEAVFAPSLRASLTWPPARYANINRTSIAAMIALMAGVYPEDGAPPCSDAMRQLAAQACARYIEHTRWHDWLPSFFKTEYGRFMYKTREVAKAVLAHRRAGVRVTPELVQAEMRRQGLRSLNG